jgi:hypothetical protein
VTRLEAAQAAVIEVLMLGITPDEMGGIMYAMEREAEWLTSHDKEDNLFLDEYVPLKVFNRILLENNVE